MILKLIAGVAVGLSLATSGFAGHANPWAGPDDVILEKRHNANQAKSANTPGQDEMRGAMQRSAFGKLGGGPATGSSEGRGAGKSGGAGGGQNGGGKGR